MLTVKKKSMLTETERWSQSKVKITCGGAAEGYRKKGKTPGGNKPHRAGRFLDKLI